MHGGPDLTNLPSLLNVQIRHGEFLDNAHNEFRIAKSAKAAFEYIIKCRAIHNAMSQQFVVIIVDEHAVPSSLKKCNQLEALSGRDGFVLRSGHVSPGSKINCSVHSKFVTRSSRYLEKALLYEALQLSIHPLPFDASGISAVETTHAAPPFA